MSDFPTDFFFDLFRNPIGSVAQVAYEHRYGTGPLRRYWGGSLPMIVLTLERDSGERSVVLAGRSYDIAWRELPPGADMTSELESFQSETAGDEDNPAVGIFDLDIAISPVPGWSSLRSTSLTIVHTEGHLLGICLHLNLGTRVGIFVTPNSGLSLTFNDQCDIIMRKALRAQEAALLKCSSVSYEGRQTPKTLEQIDWFDWLGQD